MANGSAVASPIAARQDQGLTTMDTAVASADDGAPFVIMPRSSSKGALTHQLSAAAVVPADAEPPMPPRRTDSLAARVGSNDSLPTVSSTAGSAANSEPSSPVALTHKRGRNLIASHSREVVAALTSEPEHDESAPEWSSLASRTSGDLKENVAVAETLDIVADSPIGAAPAPLAPAPGLDADSLTAAATTFELQQNPVEQPIMVFNEKQPSPIVIESSPTTPPFILENVPEPLQPSSPAVVSMPALYVEPPNAPSVPVSSAEDDAALTARLMDLLPPSPSAPPPPQPVAVAAPAPAPAAAGKNVAALQAINASLSPLHAAPANTMVFGNRTPSSPSSPMLMLGSDDAMIVAEMIGMEDPAAGDRLRMQAQLVQAQPVVDHYGGRDLETVDEEEEAGDDEEAQAAGAGAEQPIPQRRYRKPAPPVDYYDDEDPRFPRPAASSDNSPYGGSQSMEALDQERDYSGPIISGLPRSSSSPRLQSAVGPGGVRLSTYQPNVSSPLAGAGTGKGPKKRRKSFRSNRPVAYGSARHSMVGLTPENMEELKKDAHAAIRDMLMRGAEEDDKKKRMSRVSRQSTVPEGDYNSYSRPDSYYPDESASQVSDTDRNSSFAPSMRTSRTAPDMNSRNPPKTQTFRARNDDHRASMMALDNLMRNESQLGSDMDDGFELHGSMSGSDLNGDMYGDMEDDTLEDGSSGRGSSLPGNDALFDSDMLTLDQAEKALKYARRTQDVDERYHFLDFLLDHLPDLPPCDDKGRGPASDVAHNAIKLLRRLAYVHYHPPSQYTLGNLFITGLPDNVRNRTKKHKPDYARAFELWVMAAKRNHADATYNVALCTERGLGTRSSARRAADFYRKAAVLNHPGAMTRLGTALLNGDLALSKSPRDAVKWLRIALKYADTRFPRVCVELSKLHASGIDHVIIRDDDYAFELLKRGSELGDPEAQHRLGRAYELGRMHSSPDAPEVTSPNPKIAIQLYQAAANQGHADAMLEISGWYLTGWPRPGEEVKVQPKRYGKEPPFTFPQSDELAYKWARQAAEKGLGRGFYAVAYFFEHGIGTGLPPDQKEACRWYEMAAKKGDKSAIKKVQELGGGRSRFSMIWPSSFSITGSAASSRPPSTMSSARSSMYSISGAPGISGPNNGSTPMTPGSDSGVPATPATAMSAIGGGVASPMNSRAASVASMPIDPRKPQQNKNKKGRKACLIQ